MNKILIDGRYTFFRQRISMSQLLYKIIKKLYNSTTTVEAFRNYFTKVDSATFALKSTSTTNTNILYEQFKHIIGHFQKLTNLEQPINLQCDKEFFKTVFHPIIKQNFVLTEVLDQALSSLNCKYMIIIPYSNELYKLFFEAILTYNSVKGKDIQYIKKNAKLSISNIDETTILISHNIFDFDFKNIKQFYFFNSYYYSHLKYAKQYEWLENQKFNFRQQISSLMQFIPLLRFFEDLEKNDNAKDIVIGYYFQSKKQLELFNNKILFSQYPVQFIPIDFRLGYEYTSKMPIQGLFHKYTDLWKATEKLSKDITDLFDSHVNEFYQKTKNLVKFFDSLDNLKFLQQRTDFQQKIVKLLKNEQMQEELAEVCKKKNMQHVVQFKQPQTVIIPANLPIQEIQNIIQKDNFSYPFIVKTTTACITINSHLLGVCIDDRGLTELYNNDIYKNEETILQELIPHDALINKIYALNYETSIQERPSFPLLTYDKTQAHSFIFDSQVSFAKQFSFMPTNTTNCSKESRVDPDLMNVITKYLTNEFGFNIFGYDMVINYYTLDYYIIDINYFPGYRGVQDIDKRFHSYFETAQNFSKK